MGLVDSELGEVMLGRHSRARLEDVHVVGDHHRIVGPVVQLPAVMRVRLMTVPAAGLDSAVDDVDVDAESVVGDLVVSVVPAVRLDVHRVL